MRKLSRIIVGICVFLVGIIIFFKLSVHVYASSSNLNLTLHEQTKIYSSNNSDYFIGCEDYENYVSQKPEITVLTHGLGSKGYYWSNDLNIDSGSKLAYNENSLIDKIYSKLNGEVLLYYAQCNDNMSFILSKLNRNLTVKTKTDRLDDVSKHIVLIY